MRKYTILLFLIFALGVSAQSNIHHQLRIAATTTNALLDTFPDTYASEKINTSLLHGEYALLDATSSLDTFDILFVGGGDGSVY